MVDVQPVVTAQNAHALNKHVVARVDLMAPICTAHKGVALKRHIAAPADADTHGAAKALLPCRVGAIDAVKEAAGLAHDRNVLGIGHRQQRTRIVRGKTLNTHDLGVGRITQRSWDIPIGIVGNLVRAPDGRPGLKIQLGIAVHANRREHPARHAHGLKSPETQPSRNGCGLRARQEHEG